MIKHELKNCPRCDAEFECKAGSISLCQCQAIELNEGQADYVATLYDDCLCAICLAELRSEYNVAAYTARMQTVMTGR